MLPPRVLLPILALGMAACVRAPRPVIAPRPAAEPVSAAPSAKPTPSLSVAMRPPSAVLSTPVEYLRGRELMVPVDGVRVAQVPNTFDARRGERAHNAHDIMAKRGTPVLAADDGRVIRIATNAAGGLTIYATDPEEKLVYYYAHLDRYEPGIKSGSKLQKGDVIGYVGSTGNASPSAPHLHFQVAWMTDLAKHWDGVPLDARPYFALDGERRTNR